MPHIAEGDLHAYLDGALSAIDPDAEERLTAHLGRCSDCRARLDRERRIHDRSTELLAAALPEPADTPPFDAIRAGDGGVRATGESGGRSRLAWAASIAVAIGAGWIGHALLGGGGEAIPEARLAYEAAEAPAPRSVDLRVADDVDTAGGAAEGARANETPDDAAGRATAETQVSRDEAAQSPAARREVATAPEEDRSAGAPREEGEEREREDAGDPPAETGAEALRAAPSAQRNVAAAVPGAVESGEDVDARSKAFAGATWRPVALEEAVAWVGRPLLAVPDLEVVRISIAEVDGLRLARVRQTLPDGAPIELVLERPEDAFADRQALDESRSPRLDELRVTDPGSEDEATGFWRRVGLASPGVSGVPIEGVRAAVDGAWITVAAPVASDSLRAVVSRVHRLERP